MIGLLINLLVFLIVLIVVWYIARLIVSFFGGPEIILQILGLILALVLLLYLVQLFGLTSGHLRFPP